VRLALVLIVDDEAPARRRLRRLIEEAVSVADFAEAASVEQATVILGRARPDVIFLDVQMPAANGFELFERSKVQSPVVFVTAHDQHAVRAFEVNALDYLLKPVERPRLAAALARLGQASVPTHALSEGDVVCVADRGCLRFVQLAEIVCIRGADDYTEIHLAGSPPLLCSHTMKEWEARLPKSFLRIHRSTIVAAPRVLAVRLGGTAPAVRLRDYPPELGIGRSYLALVKEHARKSIPAR